MPTFLVTSKMPPALAKRVRASVRGRAWRPGTSKSRAGGKRWFALLRFAGVCAVIAIVASAVWVRRRERQALETARSALLDDLHRRAAPLTADDLQFVPRTESWLERMAGPYEGDLVPDDLHAAGALRVLLARPAVYVRGPLGGFGNAATAAETAFTSFKDGLLLCLMDPPESRTEKAVLGRVLVAYRGGTEIESRTPSARLFEEAQVGLPFLQPAWEGRVRGATEIVEVEKLEKELHAVPTDRATQAAKSGVLVFAMDEPAPLGTPAELDGERPHDVRIGVVDLKAVKLVFRVRRHVDPSWISVAKRPMYAVGLDSCALAYDVLGEFKGPR